MFNLISKYWTDKTDTDKKILSVSFILTLTALVWLFIYQPIKKQQGLLEKKNIQLASLLEQIEESVDVLQQNDQTTGLATSNSNTFELNEMVSRAATQAQIRIDNLEASKGIAKMTLSSINFQTLLMWLSDLHDNYHIVVENIQLLPTKDKAGFIDVKTLQLNKLNQ